MYGLQTFATVRQAQRFGFEPCGEDSDGILVRASTARGFVLALVPSRRWA